MESEFKADTQSDRTRKLTWQECTFARINCRSKSCTFENIVTARQCWHCSTTGIVDYIRVTVRRRCSASFSITWVSAPRRVLHSVWDRLRTPKYGGAMNGNNMIDCRVYPKFKMVSRELRRWVDSQVVECSRGDEYERKWREASWKQTLASS